MLCYISATCMSGVVTKNDPRGQGMPFVENQDGPWGSWRFGAAPQLVEDLEGARVNQPVGVSGSVAAGSRGVEGILEGVEQLVGGIEMSVLAPRSRPKAEARQCGAWSEE